MEETHKGSAWRIQFEEGSGIWEQKGLTQSGAENLNCGHARVPIIKEFQKWRWEQQKHHNDLIGWMRKNDRAAHASCYLVQFFDTVCQMTTLKKEGNE